jgi:hypothetical protein
MKKGSKQLAAHEKTLKQRATDRAARVSLPLPDVQTFRITQKSEDMQSSITKSLTLQEQLNKERLLEIQFKNRFRKYLSIFFAILLAGQNIAVFWVIFYVIARNQLKDLQLIFSVLTGATLIETYFITKIIINFVFSTSDYSSDKKIASPPGIPDSPQLVS